MPNYTSGNITPTATSGLRPGKSLSNHYQVHIVSIREEHLSLFIILLSIMACQNIIV